MIRVRCSICERWMEGASEAAWPTFPFCSQRCKTIDLGRWLGGVYRIDADEQEDSPADETAELEIP